MAWQTELYRMENQFALIARRCLTATSSVYSVGKSFSQIRLDTTKQSLNEKDCQENLLSLLMAYARNVDCLVGTVDTARCAVAADGSERRRIMTNDIAKAKPILFSTPMVEAILTERKTMTRRIVKPQPPDEAKTLCGPKTYEPIAIDKDGEMYPGSPVYGAYDENGEWGTKCPYQPGDHLYVRETWTYLGTDKENNPCFAFKANSPHLQNNMYIKWRPSIHMPKKAARIWLEVTDVRVERLQDITPNDIAAEGLPSYIIPPGHKHYNNVCGEKWLGYEWFRDLWDSFNSKRGHGWETNPWVWVVEFSKA